MLGADRGEMEFSEVKNGEKHRTYVFAGGRFTIANVSRVAVRPSGSHRVETADGKKYIVSSGWLVIEIDADEWSF